VFLPLDFYADFFDSPGTEAFAGTEAL